MPALSRFTHSWPRARWVVLAVATLYLLLFLNRGLDLTDEAYYLAWTVDPSRYTASIHPFGLPLHLLFEALGRSLIALRLAGVMMLLASGAVLGRYLGNYYRGLLPDEARRGLVPAGALYGLAYYAIWIMTPSYNMLANVGACLIFAGGLGWTTNDRDGSSRLDWLASCLVGVGGCVAFYGKPTFAAAAALAVAIMLARTLWRHGAARAVGRGVLVALFCAVPLVVIMEGSVGIGAFIASIKLGTSFGNTPGELPRRTISDIYRSSPILWINATLFAFAVAWSRERRDVQRPPAAMRTLIVAIVIADGLFLLWNVIYGSWIGGRPWVLIGMSTLCLILSHLSYGLIRSEVEPVPMRALTPVFLLLLMPFAIALGTLNGLMPQTGMSLFAMLMASTVASWLIHRPRWTRWAEIGAAGFVFTILAWSTLVPYGLPRSMLAQTEPVALPFTGDVLRVDPETRNYIVALRRLGARAGLRANTPIIDLSAGGPGAALILDGRAPVTPWLAPMPGTIALANGVWQSLTPQEQDAAWIVGPITPLFVTATPARELAEQTRQYRLIGLIPATLWDEHRLVHIWKPNRPKVTR